VRPFIPSSMAKLVSAPLVVILKTAPNPEGPPELVMP
jgi:hypothetical protein